MAKNIDLTKGNISKGLWAFAIPLMLGNVMQQFYNLADTWVVGRFIGNTALAAVGSSYTLMTFLTSIIIGLSLGSSTFISMAFGNKDNRTIRNGIVISSEITCGLTIILIIISYTFLDKIIKALNVPDNTFADMRTYLFYVFIGFFATYIYNYCSNLLRAVGNSVTPLIFLGVSVVLNIILDLYFVIGLGMGIIGAAVATVISQYIAGLGILIYYIIKYPEYRVRKEDCRWSKSNFKNILSLSGYTCIQQSVMNLGILMVQGIVNGFGQNVMAAFAVAVKIDTIAYMPAQDFGNAFSVFVAQNYGANQKQRIKEGVKKAGISVVLFCLGISALVFIFARPLMSIFVSCKSAAVISTGVTYLRIEGAFYVGIGILFMLYGFYRAINKPLMSVILTIISLGTRVVLAYYLSKIPVIGVIGIWVAIPIGWFLSDLTGILGYKFINKNTGKNL